jgi:hypothetical protein
MQLFHVRRYKCADGSFEWYVLNGHTRRRVSKSFPTRAKAEAERALLQAKLDLARRKSSGDVLMPPTIKNPAGEDGALGDAQ